MNQKTVARKKRKRKKIATKKLKKATLNHISPTKPTKTFFFFIKYLPVVLVLVLHYQRMQNEGVLFLEVA